MHNPTQPPDLKQSIARGHEPTRVSFRAAVIVTVVFVVAAVLIHLLVAGVYEYFVRRQPVHPRSPLVEANQPLPPPSPRLQPSASANLADALAHLPVAERRQMDREQAALVESWSLDPIRGVVTIPVEQAMRLLAAPGGASESSGGRTP